MAYPAMSPEEFQNANISILACQLFVMVVALVWNAFVWADLKTPKKAAALNGASTRL